MTYRFEEQIGDNQLIIETGSLAVQASGAVTVRYGENVILATAVVIPPTRENIDFLPLTVDYEERLYAVGRIPGSFFRREGRPSQEAILTDRLTDRSIRPLFPKSFHHELQIVLTVLSADQENPLETLAIIGASAALTLSEAPFQGPIGACRIGYINDQLVINPTYLQLRQSLLDMVVSSTKDAVVMVEAGANEIPEQLILKAINEAHETNRKTINLIEAMARDLGKQKLSVIQESQEDLVTNIEALLQDRLEGALVENPEKVHRDPALAVLQKEMVQELESTYTKEQVAAGFKTVLQKLVRERILSRGVRPDGRHSEDIRPISCAVGILPRTHSSGLFNRGLTQVLTVATLASPDMEQRLDTLSPENSKGFMHHYNFPPYSVGEVRRVGSPGRREIGHGALAERALLPVLPSKEVFPYTIRLVSEILSSNGSTSMASVCGSTLALMDAGVPIKAPVAGIAMGLVKDMDGRLVILTDIEGMEDQLGDMDFKVAGTADGVTALQMDIKTQGLPHAVLDQALAQARSARMFILERMKETIDVPRSEVSPLAPKIFRMNVPVSKIGAVIGSGGRTIRSLIEQYEVSIDVEDDGAVIVGSTNAENARKALDHIDSLTRDVVVGDIFTGKVTRVTSFGAFLEILPGREGLVRSSEFGEGLESGVDVGDELTVQVIEVDSMGRLNLSRRALVGGNPPPPRQEGRPRPFRQGNRDPRYGDRDQRRGPNR